MSSAPKQPTFMDLYGDGYVMEDEIDDFVDRWHEDSPVVAGRLVSLHEFLGMTHEEYEAWVHDASVLPHIVRARMSRAPLEQILSDRAGQTGEDAR